MSQVTDYSNEIGGSPLTMAQLKTAIENLVLAAASANRGAAAPSNPFEGMLWWDTGTAGYHIMQYYTGAAVGWVEIFRIADATGQVKLANGLDVTGDVDVTGDLDVDGSQTVSTDLVVGATGAIDGTNVLQVVGAGGAEVSDSQGAARKKFKIYHDSGEVYFQFFEHGAEVLIPANYAASAHKFTGPLSLDGTALTATAAEINASSAGVGVSIPKRKVLSIGDWNMDSTMAVTVNHGIADHTKIIWWEARIRDDSNTNIYSVTDGGGISSQATFFSVSRAPGGIFDNTNYDSTSYNRGWVIFDYID